MQYVLALQNPAEITEKHTNKQSHSTMAVAIVRTFYSICFVAFSFYFCFFLFHSFPSCPCCHSVILATQRSTNKRWTDTATESTKKKTQKKKYITHEVFLLESLHRWCAYWWKYLSLHTESVVHKSTWPYGMVKTWRRRHRGTTPNCTYGNGIEE